jgi:hypothetical protein
MCAKANLNDTAETLPCRLFKRVRLGPRESAASTGRTLLVDPK